MQPNRVINPGMILKRFTKFFQISGSYSDRQISLTQTQIMKFVLVVKRMQQFLTKFMEYLNKMSQKFEDNNARSASLNKFLYEYELHSVLTYSPHINTYLGNPQNLPDKQQLPEEQLLFENTNNASLKSDFEELNRRLINPFTVMR